MKDLGYGKEYLYNPTYAHPVHNEYMPPQYSRETILKKEGDTSGKVWDETKLREWEWKRNNGDDWEGRPPPGPKEDLVTD